MTQMDEVVNQRVQAFMSLLMQQSAGEMLIIMNEENLSMPQLVALHMVRCHGVQTISGLAERLYLSLAATSHLVNRMVDQGIVQRREDEADRRQRYVDLTADGERVLDRLVQARTRDIAQVMAELPRELQAQFATILERVLAHFASRSPTIPANSVPKGES